jgi:hypothetical protein
MYMVTIWEIVHSIYRKYTCEILPNLRYVKLSFVYSDVYRWITIHHGLLEDCLIASLLLLSCRQALLRFQPLDQSGLPIANRAADFHVGRAVAPHPSLRQP